MQNAQGSNNHWIIQCVPCVQCVLDRHVSHFHCLRKCLCESYIREKPQEGSYFFDMKHLGTVLLFGSPENVPLVDSTTI